jgi:hypothetical protein
MVVITVWIVGSSVQLYWYGLGVIISSVPMMIRKLLLYPKCMH